MPVPWPESGTVDVVVDRLVRGLESPERRLDSIETAFAKGLGRCRVLTDGRRPDLLSRAGGAASCGRDYLEPDPRLFRYNSPLGACPTCEGFGRVIDLDLERIVPDPSKSLRDGAIAPWTTPAYRGMLARPARPGPGAGAADRRAVQAADARAGADDRRGVPRRTDSPGSAGSSAGWRRSRTRCTSGSS